MKNRFTTQRTAPSQGFSFSAVAETGARINSAAPKFMAKRASLLGFIVLLALTCSVPAAKLPQGEWIIVVGGVSMHQWEKYKVEPHDHWWANFVHAARIRTEQLRTELGENA